MPTPQPKVDKTAATSELTKCAAPIDIHFGSKGFKEHVSQLLDALGEQVVTRHRAEVESLAKQLPPPTTGDQTCNDTAVFSRNVSPSTSRSESFDKFKKVPWVLGEVAQRDFQEGAGQIVETAIVPKPSKNSDLSVDDAEQSTYVSETATIRMLSPLRDSRRYDPTSSGISTNPTARQIVAGLAMQWEPSACCANAATRLVSYPRLWPFSRLVHNQQFEQITGMVIFLNAVLMGVQADVMARRQEAEELDEFTLARKLFATAFALEIFVRILADGKSFFTGKERKWNLFDLFIVISTVVQSVILKVWKDANLHAGVMNILRIGRALRIIRVLRTVRRFRPLYSLMSGIFAVLSSCCRALILLGLIIYFFSIALTDAVTEYLYGDDACTERNCPGWSELHSHFGSLSTSFATLFQSVCGGIDWGTPADALFDMNKSGWLNYSLFLSFVTFTHFAVLNVITALFCQQVVEHAVSTGMFENRTEELRKVEKSLLRLFHELDDLNQSEDSPPGHFTYSDLDEFMQDPRMQTQFWILGIEPSDSWILFKLLDEKQSGLIRIDQFVKGCMRLRGEAQRLDLHLMLMELMASESKIDDFMSRVLNYLDLVDEDCKDRQLAPLRIATHRLTENGVPCNGEPLSQAPS